MGEQRLQLEEQRKNIKRYEDLCAFGVLFSLLMLFNDGPAKIAGYAIGIFGWFWWSNKSKRQELDRQVQQHEQAEIIAAEVTARSPVADSDSSGPRRPAGSQGHGPGTAPPLTSPAMATRHLMAAPKPLQKGTGKVCPKCRYQRTANDDLNGPDWQCPSCGIAYAKYKPALHRRPPDPLAEMSTARRVSSFAVRALGWCFVVIAGALILVLAVHSESLSETARAIFLLLLIFGLPGLGLLYLGERLIPGRVGLAGQWSNWGRIDARSTGAKSQEGAVAWLSLLALITVFGHVSMVLMYGTMAPCKAAAKRIVAATYDDMPPPDSPAAELGQQIGRSWAQGPLERLVYADMALGPVTKCYAVAFRLVAPVSRSQDP